jgi:hypothetical protein
MRSSYLLGGLACTLLWCPTILLIPLRPFVQLSDIVEDDGFSLRATIVAEDW